MGIAPTYKTALAWQFALAAYMQLVAWFPLGGWNDQPCCPSGLVQLRRGTLTVGDASLVAVFVVPAVVFWLGALRHSRRMIAIAVAANAVWLVIQLVSWWPPYIFGASEQWERVYERAFAHSTPILTRWDHHLPPDALHLTLQVLLTAAVVAGLRALRVHASQKQPGSA